MNFTDPTVQAAFIAGITAVIAGLVGGWVGGRAATNATRLNIQDAATARAEARDEAQRERHVDATRKVAARLAKQGEAHRVELKQQVGWRRSPRYDPWPDRSRPHVHGWDNETVVELQLVAPSIATAGAARAMSDGARLLGHFAIEFRTSEKVRDGHVLPMKDDEYEAFQQAEAAYLDATAALIARVRADLGTEVPLPPAEDDHD